MLMAEKIFSLCFISLMQLKLIKDAIQIKSQNKIKILNWFTKITTKSSFFLIDSLKSGMGNTSGWLECK